MTLLLETHVWLWMLAAPERLGDTHAASGPSAPRRVDRALLQPEHTHATASMRQYTLRVVAYS